jgi:HK97 family phage major capsid protein
METNDLTPQAKRNLLDRINSGDGGQRDLPRILQPIERANIDEENRRISLSISSETPVERWWGVEILDHQAKSVDLARLTSGRFGPFLENHDPRIQLGVIESAEVNEGRKKCDATVRFGSASPAQEYAWKDVIDGIRGNVSIGYEILDLQLESEKKGAPPVYRVTRWRPFEASLCSIPADTRVGVGRSVVTPPTAPGNERKEVPMDPTQTLNLPGADGSEPAAAAATIPNPPPEIRGMESDGRRAERDRTREILAIGDQARDKGGPELARQFVDNGGSVDQFREALFAKLYGNSGRAPVVEPVVGLSRKEVKRYSLMRVVHALANPTDRRAQAAAEFEFEVSEAALKVANRGLREGAQISIPPEVFGQRDVIVGTGSLGGNLVQTDVLSDSFIEILRNKAMVIAAGATVLNGLQGNVAIPRRTGASVAYWITEGNSPTESTAVTFDQVTLSPKTVGAFVDYSRKTLLQPALSVENLMRSDLFAVLGLGVDAACIAGAGTAATPLGIVTSTAIGTSSMGAQAAAPTWAGIVACETAIAAGNADMGKMAYMLSPQVRGTLKTTVKGTAGSLGFIMENDGSVNGYPAYVTNQVPVNLTYGTTTGSAKCAIFGNWSDLLIGLWSGVDILVDPFTGSSSGTVRIVALQDVDIAFRQTASFNKLLGIS